MYIWVKSVAIYVYMIYICHKNNNKFIITQYPGVRSRGKLLAGTWHLAPGDMRVPLLTRDTNFAHEAGWSAQYSMLSPFAIRSSYCFNSMAYLFHGTTWKIHPWDICARIKRTDALGYAYSRKQLYMRTCEIITRSSGLALLVAKSQTPCTGQRARLETWQWHHSRRMEHYYVSKAERYT